VQLDNVEPTRTVLQFLREDLCRTGTKEGCAEGDCGACTVVLAELKRDDETIRYHAVNSCIQFLPTLDGKELITVESLAGADGKLHPVQQAMVDCHGSQCGFCTPGFVMSLFALYQSSQGESAGRPTRRELDDALAGNLCRCTGYRPIIAAADAMFDSESAHSGVALAAARTASSETLLKRVLRSETLRCGRFVAPRSSDELAQSLASRPGATLLAGGTDVGLWVTKQYRDLGDIIYLGEVRELQTIKATNEYLEIGATVTLADAVPALLKYFPDFRELFIRFASPPIRNTGTLGGNVANGSPIGDSMPALLALDATLLLSSAAGSRVIALSDFYKDYMVNDLAEGEFVAAIRVPLPSAPALLRGYKISKRFDQDISAVSAAFSVLRDGRLPDAPVSQVRLAFGGMAATVRRASQCEAALLGQPWNVSTVERALTALAEDFSPMSDMRASAAYRLRVAQNLLRRFCLETTANPGPTVYDYGRAS
jgi:xanthine dehydrogenase small subunit